MSTIKTVATFIAGIGAGLAIAYALDPEGSKKKLADLKAKLNKGQNMVDGKGHEYKEDMEDVSESYSPASKRKS